MTPLAMFLGLQPVLQREWALSKLFGLRAWLIPFQACTPGAS
jgi:hypothetical protein